MTTSSDDLRLAADFAPATQDDWTKLVDGVLKGAPFEKLVGKTYDGIKIDPIYSRAKGAAPIAGRARRSALADHAADRSSRCGAGQRAGAARPRERRHGLGIRICRRTGRPGLWHCRCISGNAGARCATASISTPASCLRSIRCSGARTQARTSPMSSKPAKSIPPPSTSISTIKRSAPWRCAAMRQPPGQSSKGRSARWSPA